MSAFDFRGQGLEALRPTLQQIEAVCGGEEPDGLTPQQWTEQLRAGAREHAEFQRTLPTGHRGAVPFPQGDYPVTLAELCGQVELQAGMIEAQAKQVHALELRLAALDRWCAAADRWREAGANE